MCVCIVDDLTHHHHCHRFYYPCVWSHFVSWHFFFLLYSLVDNNTNSLSRLRIDGAWMGNFHHKALMIFASVSAYTAPALMTVCLFTDHWIYGNQTRLSGNLIPKAGDPRILNYTYHRIGLWRECARNTSNLPYVCEIVRYSKKDVKLEKGFTAVARKISF